MSRRKAEKEVSIALPITPMLDMSFQLLFYFVMNFKPMSTEAQEDFQVLGEDTTGAGQSTDVLEEKRQEYKIVLIDPDRSGIPLALKFHLPSDTEGEMVPIDENYKSLRAKLDVIPKKVAEGVQLPMLRIESGGTVRYSEVIKILSICRQEKVEKVGLSTPKKPNTPPQQ